MKLGVFAEVLQPHSYCLSHSDCSDLKLTQSRITLSMFPSAPEYLIPRHTVLLSLPHITSLDALAGAG